MSRIIGVVQARNGSKRLPQKSMLPLAGKPLLYRFIERVKKSALLDEVILATTEKSEDDSLVEIAEELGIKTFRGAEDDLVGRIYDCAVEHNADVIVRLCADNPLIEAEEVDRIIECYLNSRIKDVLFTNTQEINGNGYPDGLGAEVYDMELFSCLHHNITDHYSREHPHDFFYQNDFVETCTCPEELKYPHITLDVNTQSEYDFIKSIYDKFGADCHFTDYINTINEKMVV